ncbi:TPA: phage protein NinX family protein [Providencia alcalifaciens]
MNKYTELSDFEINKKVASHYLPCDYNLNEHTKTVELIGFLGDTDEYNVYGTFDPCNNPSDAMPIIIENKISAVPQLNGDLWICSHHLFYVTTNNLYRAAMETYLLIKDAENEG